MIRLPQYSVIVRVPSATRDNSHLPVAALVQVRRADVRMINHRPALRKRINVVGHGHILLYGKMKGFGVSLIRKKGM